MIRSRFQGIDLNGVRGPVLKKQPEGFFRKFSRRQCLHKLRAADPPLPPLGDLPINPIHVRSGFLSIHLDIHRSLLVLLS
jgi:hypothetical protein